MNWVEELAKVVPELRRDCLCIDDGPSCTHCWRKGELHSQDCSNCQGCDWMLIPMTEQMGVLVRIAQDFIEGMFWRKVWRYDVTLHGKIGHGEGETPEEALAHAIFNAQNLSRTL